MTERFEIGDYYSGVLLETYTDGRTSRPRVRALEHFLDGLKVEFPRALREEHPLGTRFKATVKVSQKHNRDGSLRGGPYLVASNNSIELENDYSPIRQIFAVPISDRVYEYVDETPKIVEDPLISLRKLAYEVAVENVQTRASTSVQPKRDPKIRSYALERSKGFCEACGDEAPFFSKNGDPYLEVHHITALSDGGADHPLNVAAICPNCHRRTEKSDDRDEYNELIRKKIISKEKELG